MKIDFRQGIVTYPEVAGLGQAFLQFRASPIDAVDIIGDVTVAFAQRNADYLHVEVNTVERAWTGVPTSGNAWLFWDIDTQSAVVTYGFTTIQPTSGSTEPTGVEGLHWFDSANIVQNVFEGGKFVEKIRVFAARINGTSLFPLGSNAATPYSGTQVGINQTTFAGQILFAEGLPVIISVSGVFTPGQILVGSPPRVTANPFAKIYTFATTETSFLMGGSQKVNSIRLESDVVTATAAQNLAAYKVVQYNTAGQLELASYNNVESTTIAIVVDDHLINEVATVILQGKITNEQWNWPNVGAELFVETNGNLIETDPNLSTPSLFPVSKPPVARVVNSKEIIFMQGLGKVGPRGLNPESIGTIGDVTLTQPVTAGEVLQFTGSPETWRNDRPVIDDLEDVIITNATSDQRLVFSGSPLFWRNQDIVSVNGVEPVTRNSSTVFLRTDAGKGIVSTTVGSPLPGAGSPESITWTLRAGDFDLGDVITLVRRFNAHNVNIVTGPNVQVVSQLDGSSIGSPLPGAGSPNTNQFTLDNPAQAELWLHEVVGSPIRYGSPLPAGSPGLATPIGSPGKDVWLLSGAGFTFA